MTEIKSTLKQYKSHCRVPEPALFLNLYNFNVLNKCFRGFLGSFVL